MTNNSVIVLLTNVESYIKLVYVSDCKTFKDVEDWLIKGR